MVLRSKSLFLGLDFIMVSKLSTRLFILNLGKAWLHRYLIPADLAHSGDWFFPGR